MIRLRLTTRLMILQLRIIHHIVLRPLGQQLGAHLKVLLRHITHLRVQRQHLLLVQILLLRIILVTQLVTQRLRHIIPATRLIQLQRLQQVIVLARRTTHHTLLLQRGKQV